VEDNLTEMETAFYNNCLQHMASFPLPSGLKEGGHLEDPAIDGRIILKWIFENGYGGHGLNRSASGKGQVVGTCE
jgi:hypothetical protein